MTIVKGHSDLPLSVRLSVRPFVTLSGLEFVNQLLPQFLMDLFETLHTCCGHIKDAHVGFLEELELTSTELQIEICLNKNNSKRAYKLVKDLTSEKEGRSSTIQDKPGKCLTEETEILSRWTEYCSELYNYESCGDNAVLNCSQPRKEICNQSFVRKLRLQ